MAVNSGERAWHSEQRLRGILSRKMKTRILSHNTEHTHRLWQKERWRQSLGRVDRRWHALWHKREGDSSHSGEWRSTSLAAVTRAWEIKLRNSC